MKPSAPSSIAETGVIWLRREDGTDHRMELGDIFATAREGSENAWAMLVERLSNMIRSITRSYRLSHDDVCEITQTMWLRLLENADSIREPRAVGAWLAVTTRRECIKATRDRTRERSTEIELIAEALGVEDDLEMLASMSERREALAEALKRLPVQQRLLLQTLMAEPTPSYLAISQTLKLPIGSIGPTRGRALARLRENGALRAAFED